MQKRWPTDPPFEHSKLHKNVFLKTDCSELAFKNVLLAQAGSTFLQKYENKIHQSKKIFKMYLANYIVDANSQQDLKKS